MLRRTRALLLQAALPSKTCLRTIAVTHVFRPGGRGHAWPAHRVTISHTGSVFRHPAIASRADCVLGVARLISSASGKPSLDICLYNCLPFLLPSGARLTSFEIKPKDKSIKLRLSGELYAAVRKRAARAGVPYQRFIRLTLEQAIGGPK